MSERRLFRLLWKTLDRRRRWEIRRLAWLGRPASDAETAWFVTAFAGWFVRWSALYVVVALGWMTLGVVTIDLIRDAGTDRPVTVAIAIGQIALGVIMLALLAMYRRAHRLNRPLAVAPGRG